MWSLSFIYIFFCAFFLTSVFIGVFRRLALRWEFVDRPDEIRKIQGHPVPLLGGPAMFLGFTLTLLLNLGLLFAARNFLNLPGFILPYIPGILRRLPQIGVIVAASLLLLIMGLIDDRKKIRAGVKLLIEIALALLLFAAGIRITFFIHSRLIGAILTVLWIVGITNAFNLLDNMDGLSSGTAIISGTIFLIIALQGGHFFVAAMLCLFLGTLCAFLKINFPPARMYMGDAGSLFIGFTLSILTIINTYYHRADATIAPVIMPLIILAIPIFDTFSVIFIRLRRRIPIFTPDNNHLSHRLLKLGMNKKEAVFFIYLINLCIGLGALLLMKTGIGGTIIVFIQAVSILAITVFLERVHKK